MSGPSVKVPADWLESDHIEDLGADVVLLMLTALGYSARQTTNGVVPRRRLSKLWPVADVDKAIELLTDAGEIEDRGEDVLFVRWNDFLLTRDEVEQTRARNRERTERSRRHQRGDHTICRPEYCRAAALLRDQSRDDARDSDGTPHVSDGHPIRPDPTRPLGRGRGEGAATGSAGAPPDAGPAETSARRSPHAFAYHPDDPAGQDDDSTGEPCTYCGQSYWAMPHHAHDFVNGDLGAHQCAECWEAPDNPVHHYDETTPAVTRDAYDASSPTTSLSRARIRVDEEIDQPPDRPDASYASPTSNAGAR